MSEQTPLEGQLAALEEMARMGPGWNSYKAKPIRPECIDEARRLVVRLAGEAPLPNLAPLASGEIEAEWEYSTADGDCALWYVCLELRGDGRGFEAGVLMIPALVALAGKWGDTHEC